MTIEILWDDPEQQTILRYDIGEQWAWNDFYVARQHVYDLMDSTELSRIYTIAHFKQNKVKIPFDVMKHLPELSAYSHPKAGLMVIVGAGRLMKAAFSGFKKVFVTTTNRSLDFAYADTLINARQIIQQEKENA